MCPIFYGILILLSADNYCSVQESDVHHPVQGVFLL